METRTQKQIKKERANKTKNKIIKEREERKETINNSYKRLGELQLKP